MVTGVLFCGGEDKQSLTDAEGKDTVDKNWFCLYPRTQHVLAKKVVVLSSGE